MKINYVAYLDPFAYNGGGEMIMRRLIEVGRERDHDITLCTVLPKKNKMYPFPDLTILCDVFNSPKSLKKFDKKFIFKLIETNRYIHFDNAYVDCCNLDYLPCSGKAECKCQYKHLLNLRSNIRRFDFFKKCFQQKRIVETMYEKSMLNVFLSPLHQKTIHSMLHLNKGFFVLRPLIDTEKFYDMHLERDIDFLFVGAIGEAKGLENMCAMFSDQKEKLTVIGNVIGNPDLSFAEYLGTVPYKEIPQYFNRAKNFVFLPRWPEPQGRVVVEAALCGCNLITNNNVGATSFEFDISDSNNLENADHEFWKVIEKL